MIIWRGWGILAAILPLALAGILAGAGGTSQSMKGWPNGLVFLGSAIAVWPLGRYLNRPRPWRSGEPASPGPTNHSLFFIPMEYFGPVYAVVALLHFARVFG